ncbi:MAG TPA: hypothetical protein VMT01_01195 [Candidatus Acidoferrum sp.]|nr:hypothetical protein [Candidatus Acidoferrum sp.]
MKKFSIVLLCIFFGLSLTSNLSMLTTHKAVADSAGVYVYPCHVLVVNADDTSPHGLTPTQIRSAYNLPATGGTGTIAIVDAFDDPTILNDANVFSAQFNLPNLTDATFEKHKMASNITFDANWSDEISLDVEWAHAIAPNAKILLVEATTNNAILPDGTAGPLLNAVDYARGRSDVVAVSMSWGSGSGGLSALGYDEPTYNPFFTSGHGVIFFAASGDQGENASWPASSPNVVGVGGTTLNFRSDGSVASETVWNDSGYTTGGGISPSESEPSYQLSYGVQSNGHRAVPDVSYCADQNPGYPIFANYSGQQWKNSMGGTSAGAPQWAAILSDGRLYGSNDRYYTIAESPSHQSCFRDIINGTNGAYNAASGYDFVTGLGSPLTTEFHYPPTDPTLSGPQTVVRNVWYTYTTNGVVDPDGAPIRYHLNATGPGTPYQNTTIWVSSGTPMSWNLMWEPTDNPGAYLIQAWVEDSYGMLSHMASLSVSMNVTVSITNSGGGTTSPASGSYTYDYGTSVSIAAYPNANKYFWFWTANNSATGDRYYGAQQTAFTMNITEDFNITAWFGDYNYTFKYPNYYALTCIGDINFDGVCNMKDIAIVINLFNKNQSSPDWQSSGAAGVDILCICDGVINMRDTAFLISNFNKHI